MNKGGFSWKRLVGITKAKQKISRTIGVPLTKSGRQRKIGKIVTGGKGCLLSVVLLSLLLALIPFLIYKTTNSQASQSLLKFTQPPLNSNEVETIGRGDLRVAQRGCCSHHQGVCGCDNGRKACCDGTDSPSCTCSSSTDPNSQTTNKSYNLPISDKQPVGTCKVTKIVDGDTIYCSEDGMKLKIRLIGIDAPESSTNPKTYRDAERTGKSIKTIEDLGKK